jgi:PAS domain S-box-containing protein
MHYQYIPYIWPLIASAATSLSLGIYAVTRRLRSKGAISFILSMIVVTLWSSANALEMSSIVFSTKLFWANVQYLSYCFSPLTLLALCMEFTGHDKWIRSRKIFWLAVIPTIIIFLVWTDEVHGLVRYGMQMDYSGEFPVIIKKYGPAFLVHAVYSQFINLFAWVLLIKAVYFKNTVYKKQAAALLIGVSLIILPNILYILGLSPVKRFDITPLFFAPAGIIVAWGIFRYKLFDVIPVAWAQVIRTMEAGLMILDLQNRVLEINPAFEKIAGCTAKAVLTRPVNEVYSNIPELVDALQEDNISHVEFTKAEDGISRIYEAVISTLADRKGILVGRLVIIYDITRKKQEQQLYLQQQWGQAVRMEKERHARDMHDNLGQILGFISLQTQGIKQELINAGVDSVSQELDKLASAAQTANDDIREYIRRARNEQDMESDFIKAVEQDITRFEDQTGLEVRLEKPDSFQWNLLDADVRLNLLNIIKEAMNNIRKHAEASNVKISFSLAGTRLHILIEDDGKGFETNQVKSMKTRYGLGIMKERAAEIGAQMEIESKPGDGCRISLLLPFMGGEKNEIKSYAGG